jgi:hypothetical protein
VSSNEVKLSPYVIEQPTLKTWGSAGTAAPFFTSSVNGAEWSASHPSHFVPGTHCIGEWVGPRAGVYTGEEVNFLTLLGIEPKLSSP